MLRILRENARKIATGIFITFILFGVGSGVISSIRTGKNLAEVFGKKINSAQFENAYRTVYFSPRVQNLLAENEDVTPEMLENSTLQHIAFLHEAKKRKLKVSDEELSEAITARFSVDGQFQAEGYKYWVQRNTGLTLGKYEEGVRNELLVQKLITGIRDLINVEDQEISDYFYKENRKIQVEYLKVAPTQFEEEIEFSNGDIVKYYQQNLGKFQTDKKYKFNFIIVKPTSFIESISVSENEIIDYYKNNADMFPSENNTEPDAYKAFKDDIENNIKSSKANEAAKQQALEFKRSVTGIEQLKQKAAEYELEIKETGFIGLNEVEKEIGWSNNLKPVLDKMRPRSLNLLETSNGFILINMINVKDPELIEFADSKENAIKLYKATKAFQKASTIMQKVNEDVRNTEDTFDTLAEKHGIESESPEPFFNGYDIIITDNKTTKDIFDLLWDKEIGFTSNPIPVANKDILIIRLTNVENPEESEFIEQKEDIKERLLQFKQFMEVQTGLSEILKRADIKKFNKKTDISDR